MIMEYLHSVPESYKTSCSEMMSKIVIRCRSKNKSRAEPRFDCSFVLGPRLFFPKLIPSVSRSKDEWRVSVVDTILSDTASTTSPPLGV